MLPSIRGRRVWLLVLLWALAGTAWGQLEDNPQDPVPPPLPPRQPPREARKYEPVLPPVDVPWGLPADLLAALREQSIVYRSYAQSFTCNETARLADYNPAGEVTSEKVQHYGYLLLSGERVDFRIREFRQAIGKDGKVKAGEVGDAQPFPPAYAWVFMFDPFFEPYFKFRLLDTRFDGYDLIHEIEFKGQAPFTDGRDIRQWEGRVLVEVFKRTPVEISAEPVNQRERIEALYRQYAQSFNILGFRTKPTPLGYRARVLFQHERDGLRFPTELRYDTQRAVGPTQVVPVSATIRTYEGYRFTVVTPNPSLGDVVEP